MYCIGSWCCFLQEAASSVIELVASNTVIYNDGGTRAIINGIEEESITRHCQGRKLVGNQYCIISFSLILKLGFKVLHYLMADIAQIRQLVITHD